MDFREKTANFFKAYPLRSYDKRELLLRAEEPVESVFYITEGRVSQYDIAPNGNEVIVNIFKPGAFFPMSSAINNTVNQYFFEASLASKTHVAPKANVLQFLHENPDIAFDLLARVYRGVDGILRRMAHLMGGKAQTRLIFELLNSAYRFGEPKPTGSVFIQLTEGDLSKQSGLARETINRSLHDLKATGLITVSRNGVLIKDITALEAQLGNDL